jgi:hypothetical protein
MLFMLGAVITRSLLACGASRIALCRMSWAVPVACCLMLVLFPVLFFPFLNSSRLVQPAGVAEMLATVATFGAIGAGLIAMLTPAGRQTIVLATGWSAVLGGCWLLATASTIIQFGIAVELVAATVLWTRSQAGIAQGTTAALAADYALKSILFWVFICLIGYLGQTIYLEGTGVGSESLLATAAGRIAWGGLICLTSARLGGPLSGLLNVDIAGGVTAVAMVATQLGESLGLLIALQKLVTVSPGIATGPLLAAWLILILVAWGWGTFTMTVQTNWQRMAYAAWQIRQGWWVLGLVILVHAQCTAGGFSGVPINAIFLVDATSLAGWLALSTWANRETGLVTVEAFQGLMIHRPRLAWLVLLTLAGLLGLPPSVVVLLNGENIWRAMALTQLVSDERTVPLPWVAPLFLCSLVTIAAGVWWMLQFWTVLQTPPIRTFPSARPTWGTEALLFLSLLAGIVLLWLTR